MVFSSPTFLFIFLPVTLLIYHALPLRSVYRNWWLLVASVVFYFWGAGSAIIAIAFVSVSSFFGAYLAWVVTKGRGFNAANGRLRVTVILAAVLAPLLLFKYVPQLASYDFPLAARAFDAVSASSWTLPLGISFFTFHAMSYVIDSAKAEQPLARSFGSYLLYLFVFPHQIAGPIVRYTEHGPQIESARTVSPLGLGYGITRFSWGLAKKVLIADNCGVIADAFFENAGLESQLSAPGAWIGALAYAMQIYFDFSGYSDMAIGLAMMFGFRFPENFFSPYTSVSVTDFWRRWHITLTRWFRDYVYIPLGGNRHGRVVEYLALALVFLLTSLWHGALAGFLIWGALHSLALLIERMTGLRSSKRFVVPRRALTFLFVLLAWVPFRTTTTGTTLKIWDTMFTGPWDFVSPFVLVSLTPITLFALAVGVLSVVGPSRKTGFEMVFGTSGLERLAAFRWKSAWAITPPLLTVALCLAIWSDFSPFLYFQF